MNVESFLLLLTIRDENDATKNWSNGVLSSLTNTVIVRQNSSANYLATSIYENIGRSFILI